MATIEEIVPLIERAADRLVEHGANEVYLFGSAVTGRWREDSDIDLAVSGLPPKVFFRAMADACDILGRQIDLVDIDQDNPFTRYLRAEEGELQRVR